ncbi:L-glyceraldehyde 3-phosphate reductase [Actinotalea sp. BY-33]|uniref:L-glyceraldehyde 3-phosphate reductase n=1 Tax=Actinotalea soli TaxID=2819234 RepID=A0A939LSX2_9CELL|nr:L-glyceraldehyde 3-phosphate reductase [Actinotalea soli]MBO1753288.1 L-glyceraldehyde 3-phosphate reductase [Actinotalea soli]
MQPHRPASSRYDTMTYRRAGRSGLDLPAISLGLWQNFGAADPFATQRAVVLRAIDRGVTHLDLANNYGPPPGSAEANLGRLLASDLRGLRDELVISTKAGYRMWPGPYGEHGSRKYLLASLDQSLARLGLDTVDIFYSHRFDPTTPLEETLGALRTAVESGRALYAGISSYSARRTREALAVADQIGLRLLVHQPSYSMLNRWIEEPSAEADGACLLDVLDEAGLGAVVFSPLAQGMLTGKYLDGVPAGSRAAREGSLPPAFLREDTLGHVRALDEIARRRGQSLAQMALTWALRDPRVTSVLLGASSPEQLDENLAALDHPTLDAEELVAIDEHAIDAGINLWAERSSDL